MIIADFKRFGDIISVKIDKEKFEAYVTFKDFRSAEYAFTSSYYENTQKKIKSQKWFVEAANTWEQPCRNKKTRTEISILEKNQIENENLPILQLNEDCFHYLFKFLKSDDLASLALTCTYFNDFLIKNEANKNRHFKRFDECVFMSNRDQDAASIRTELQCVGKHIKKISFFSDSMTREQKGFYDEVFENRLFGFIVENCGENLRELHLTDFYQWPPKREFHQIFHRLHALCIENSGEMRWENVNLPSICPNLNTLQINGAHFAFWGHLPNLRKLSFLNSSENTKRHLPMIRSHQQISTLKFMLIDGWEQTSDVANHLLNLENIAINCSKIAFQPQILSPLTWLEHLRSLTICEIATSFDEIYEGVLHLPNLNKLKLHADKHSMNDLQGDEARLIDIAVRLTNLETLYLLNIVMESETLLGIVTHAKNLKTAHIHGKGSDQPHNYHENITVELSDSVVQEIVEVCRSQQKTEPLSLFLNQSTRKTHFKISEEDKQFVKFNERECFDHPRFLSH